LANWREKDSVRIELLESTAANFPLLVHEYGSQLSAHIALEVQVVVGSAHYEPQID